MTIRVVCRNGHALKVSDSSAGKSGQCPVCKALVQIPLPEPDPTMSEEAILDLIGMKPMESPSSSLARASSVDALEEGVDGASADEDLPQVQRRDGGGGAHLPPLSHLCRRGGRAAECVASPCAMSRSMAAVPRADGRWKGARNASCA